MKLPSKKEPTIDTADSTMMDPQMAARVLEGGTDNLPALRLEAYANWARRYPDEPQSGYEVRRAHAIRAARDRLWAAVAMYTGPYLSANPESEESQTRGVAIKMGERMMPDVGFTVQKQMWAVIQADPPPTLGDGGGLKITHFSMGEPGELRVHRSGYVDASQDVDGGITKLGDL
jgi:hypothetical protein